MRITIGGIRSVSKDPARKDGEDAPAPGTRLKDRRKSRADRRKSVRDGVIVKLSFKKERRSGVDRRKQGE